MSIYVEGLIILTGINIMLGLGYWLTANTNQFSLGHAGFMSIGAYSSSLLTLHFGWPLAAAMLIGGLAAAVAGVLVGLPGLRLSMLHLAMVTLAFAQLVQIGFSTWEYMGGTSGLAGMEGTTLPLVVATTLATLAGAWMLSRSRLGLESIAVREDELAASAAGLNIVRLKVATFGASAYVTGVAGALLGHYLRYIQPSSFNVAQSVVIILFVVFGGLYTFWGPVVGAIVLTLLPEYSDLVKGYYLFFYGGLMVLLMIVRPQGLIQPRRFIGQRRGRPPMALGRIGSMLRERALKSDSRTGPLS